MTLSEHGSRKIVDGKLGGVSKSHPFLYLSWKQNICHHVAGEEIMQLTKWFGVNIFSVLVSFLNLIKVNDDHRWEISSASMQIHDTSFKQSECSVRENRNRYIGLTPLQVALEIVTNLIELPVSTHAIPVQHFIGEQNISSRYNLLLSLNNLSSLDSRSIWFFEIEINIKLFLHFVFDFLDPLLLIFCIVIPTTKNKASELLFLSLGLVGNLDIFSNRYQSIANFWWQVLRISVVKHRV